MGIESADGLIQALNPESGVTAADVQAFLSAQIEQARSSVKGEANAAAAELRKARGELLELRGLKSTYEADIANLREQAEKGSGAAERLTEYEQQLAEIKAERDALAGYRDRYATRAFRDLVADHGRIADRDYVPAIVERLGLKPTIGEDGSVSLDDAGRTKLEEFLADPTNRAKYQGGRPTFHRGGGPAPAQREPAAEAIRKRIDAQTDPAKRAAMEQLARRRNLI